MSRPYNKKRGGGGFHSPFPYVRANNGVMGAQPGAPNRVEYRGNHQHNNRRGGRYGGTRGGSERVVDSHIAGVMKTLLTLLFEKSAGCFNTETGMLNISDMRGSPDLASASKSVDFNNVAFCRCIAEVLRKQFGNQIRFIDISNNQIRRLTPFLQALMEVNIHASIAAINAANNDIDDLSFLGQLKEFPLLTELLLTNNLVTNHKDYRGQILRTLSNLTMLDAEPVKRNLLMLPNPLRAPSQGELHLQVLDFLNRNLLSVMNYGEIDQIVPLYAQGAAALSISQNEALCSSRLPINVVCRTVDLSKVMRNAMQADLTAARKAINWRNLLSNTSCIRNVAQKPSEIRSYLRAFCGFGLVPSLQFCQLISASASVSVLEHEMKVRIYVVTLHGRMKYLWNPVDSSTGNRVFPEGKEPFVPRHFDRTIVMVDTNNTVSITNDMIFCRPNHGVLPDEDNSLFFADSDDRVEQMRRKLLPGANCEVMKHLVLSSQSDYALQNLVQQILQAGPPPESLHSVEAVKNMLQL
ncbi:unnamed protein product [Phytomonas sp. EM1]|nr:unnamed protein product [Phytomonas sp. EM1]|eukprot:CCW60924.1 unnamed protein product [Phytomonas sp. isolate EM1]